MSQYRQGDVLIVRVDELPAGIKPIKGEIILAHGEATGHAHRVKNRCAKFFAFGDRRFLTATKTVRVVHDEHDPLELPAGTYQVIRQREYSPEAIRNVAD